MTNIYCKEVQLTHDTQAGTSCPVKFDQEVTTPASTIPLVGFTNFPMFIILIISVIIIITLRIFLRKVKNTTNVHTTAAVEFQVLFEASPGCFLVLDPKLFIVAVNNAYLAATMTKRETIIGRYIFDVFPNNPSDSKADGEFNLDGSLKRVLQTGVKDTMGVQKYDIRTPSGEFQVRYWSPVNIPVLNNQSEVIYIIHRVEDVTNIITTETRVKALDKDVEEKTNEIYERTRELKATNDRLDGIINSTSDLVAAIDSNGRFTVLNKSYQSTLHSILGIKLKVGMELQEVFLKSPNMEKKWRRALKGEEFTIIENWETTLGLCYYEIRYNIIHDKNGTLIGVCQVGRNITERHKMEEALKKAKEEAELANQVKTKFFHNVSHEFRTPLTLILGPLETVLTSKENPITPQQRLQLESVQRNALRMLKLVNSILDFSRLEANRVQAVFEPVDLARFTAELASAFSSEIQKNGLIYSVETPPLSQPIYIDRALWEKIILNLISNAFKFTTQGHITVRLKESIGFVELEVEDTGIGIPEKDLPNIFERFFRAQSAKSRSIEGTGIGLSLVQECVKLHHGQIMIDSKEGLGTTFKVRIPSGTSHLPAERLMNQKQLSLSHATKYSTTSYVKESSLWSEKTLSKAQKVSPNINKPLVLLAEDNFDMRRYIEDLLSSYFELIYAENGKIGLELAKENRPDLILTDVTMPVMDGFEFLKSIREDDTLKLTPVIMLSARAGEEARVEGLRASADDYLVKPFSGKELLARIHTHMELSRLRKKLELQVQERTKELQQAYEQLKKASEEYKRLQEEFIDSVCHEVRNPLNIIYSGIDLLQQDLETLIQSNNREFLENPGISTALSKIKELANIIALSAKLQRNVIDEVLVFSKWENNPTELTITQFNPNEILYSMRELFRHAISEKKLAFNLEVPQEEIIIKSDQGRINEILMNLISNAIKFTLKGSISISLKYPPVEIPDKLITLKFTVSDTGEGMDPEEKKLIFQRFSQSYSKTSDGTGFGLGLAICKKMVESLGGEIQVESQKGIGSHFHFQISCTANRLKKENLLPNLETSSPDKENTRYIPQHILVVDDNMLNQKVLVTHLTQVGHLCKTAADGKEAVSLAEKIEFNVIVMDIMMPVMDGFTATNQIRLLEQRLNRSPVYIIGLSGNARETYADQARASGMNDYITKPYKKQELYEKIAQGVACKQIPGSPTTKITTAEPES